MEQVWAHQFDDDSAIATVAVDELAIVVCETFNEETATALHRDTGTPVWTHSCRYGTWMYLDKADAGRLVRVRVPLTAQYIDPASGLVVAEDVLDSSRVAVRSAFHGASLGPSSSALPVAETCTPSVWAALAHLVLDKDVWPSAICAHDLLCAGTEVFAMARDADGLYSAATRVVALPPKSVFSTPVPVMGGRAVAFMTCDRDAFCIVTLDGVTVARQCLSEAMVQGQSVRCWFPNWCIDSRHVYLSNYYGCVFCFALPRL